MKRNVVLGGVASLLLAGLILATLTLNLSQASIGYVDDFLSAHAEIVIQYYALLLLLYFIVYATSVALCLPLASVMAIIGGLIFGVAGLLIALLSVTIGSVLPFLAARRFGTPALARFNSELVNRFRRGFDRNQFQYLILMRLIPWAPFTVTTIIAGALGMGLVKFLIATGLGFLPTGLALNAIGHGLGRLAELRNISAVELYRDPDFLMASAGVGAIVLLTLLRRLPFVTRLFG
jgi:uncharacterized membrane protein YdjX (TVP38/TMEM64 family)